LLLSVVKHNALRFVVQCYLRNSVHLLLRLPQSTCTYVAYTCNDCFSSTHINRQHWSNSDSDCRRVAAVFHTN